MNDMSYRLNNSTGNNREREWNEVAGEWDDLAREYNLKLYQHYHDRLWLPQVTLTNKQIRILDFGCGTGLFIEKLVHYYQNRFVDDLPVETDIPRVHIIGVDTATSMIQTLKEKIRNYGWNDNECHITVTALVADVSTWEEDHRHDDEFHNWYGHVDLIVANSVMSYLPTTPLNDNSEVSPLESTIQIFTKLLQPKDGYFIHADWTDFSLPSPLMTTDMTMSHFKDTTTTAAAHQNHDATCVPLRRTNNGVMNYSAAQWLYINLINNYEFDMDTVETKVFPNVYHHYNHDDHHDSDTDSSGSRILVGRARLKSLPTNVDVDHSFAGRASH